MEADGRCWHECAHRRPRPQTAGVAEGQYGLVHPSGWSIGRYIVNCVETYMLWHGNETQGRFSTADEAKRKHIDLCAWTPEMQARK